MLRVAVIKGLGALVCFLGVAWLMLDYFVPSPPPRITIATGAKGTSLDYFGQRYQKRFARAGIELQLRETAGTTENCKLLHDPNSGVDIAFVTAGFCDDTEPSSLQSLGAVADVPVWVFYTSAERLDGLSQLKGKRIAAGREGSGVRDIAEKILGKANVNSQNAFLLPFVGNAAVEALTDGKVDAVIILSVPDAPATRALLTSPRFRIMDFSTAEAFTRIFPEFVRLVWPKGIVEIDPPNPPNDVTLIGSAIKIIIRNSVHPSIVQLLAQALKEEHGGAGLFQRAGEFPRGVDAGFPMSAIAVDYYRNGPSLLQEYLPFWMTIYARRAIALLVTMLAIALPVFSFAPRLYGWFVQEYLRRLYRRLRVVENALRAGSAVSHRGSLQSELTDIEQAASAVPMRNSDLYFMLKYHLDRMRSHLREASHASEGSGIKT
jgi:TRAP-type uncharacterized transport system substrate-binding protein